MSRRLDSLRVEDIKVFVISTYLDCIAATGVAGRRGSSDIADGWSQMLNHAS